LRAASERYDTDFPRLWPGAFGQDMWSERQNWAKAAALTAATMASARVPFLSRHVSS